MTEQPSIFSEIENAKIEANKKRLHKKILTGQIIVLLLSIILFLVVVFSGDIDSYIPIIIISLVVLISILSFKWPFPCLFILSVLYSIMVVVSSLGTLMQPNELRSDNAGYLVGEIIGFCLFLSIPYFIIRSTIAAKKYSQLNKRP